MFIKSNTQRTRPAHSIKKQLQLVFVFIAIAWVSIGSSPVLFAADEKASVQDRAVSWSLMRLIVENQCTLPDRISATDVDNGQLGGTVNVKDAGFHVSSEGGTITCKDAFTRGIELWGSSDYRVFMTSIGYKQDSLPNGDFVKDSYTNDKLVNAIPAKYFAGNRTSASNDILYHIFYTSFVQGCGATFKIQYSKASNNDKNKVNSDDNTYRLFQVAADGTVEDAIYTAEKGKGKIVSVGYGIGTNNAGKADCYELSSKLQNKALADAYAVIVKSGNDTTPVTAGAQQGNKSDNGSDCSDAGFVLGWIICPIGTALAEGTKIIDDQLYSLLYINTATWENSGVKTAWESFRVISSVLIVLVALVGIASQVFSFDFISAYSIRKILPKLFIAVILIQLSWFLAVTAINISNAVGFSVQALISAPFEAIAQQYNDGQALGNINGQSSTDGWIGFADVLTVYAKNDTGANSTGLAAAGTIAGGGIIAAIFSAPVILSFAGGLAGAATVGVGAVLTFLVAVFLPVFLALLTAFIVIVLRIVLMIALTMVVPLAIVAWILPNTKKWFDKWWAMFFALLAFFPIIIVFITSGKIASLILATSAGDSGLKNFVVLLGVIIAYFVPYFLIFKLIKFSGGALGKVQNAIDGVNNKVRSNEPLQGWRKKQKESAKFYGDERARRRTENARAELTALEGQRGFRNSLRRTRAGLQQNAALGQLGNSGYFGETRESKLDETLDKSKQEADSAVVRQMRGLTADESTKYLETLNSEATRRQFQQNNGVADITVGDKTFRVTDSMWAASLPRQKDFKNSIDDILQASYSEDPHLAAIAKRVVSDNGAMVDGMATDFSRTGAVLDKFVGYDALSEVREIARDKMYNDAAATQKAVVSAQEQYDQVHGDGSFALLSDVAKQTHIDRSIDDQIDSSAEGLLKTIRAKQTANYKDLPTHRRKKVQEAIQVLSGNAQDEHGNPIAATEAQMKEAIGLAMQLVGQGRELTGADLTELSRVTGVDIETVYNGGGNMTLEIQGGRIEAVPSGRSAPTPTPPPATGGGTP